MARNRAKLEMRLWVFEPCEHYLACSLTQSGLGELQKNPRNVRRRLSRLVPRKQVSYWPHWPALALSKGQRRD